MATSGAVAAIAGYLIKDNIGSYFTSISIAQGYEIRKDQWVKINGFDEGKVENITKLVTRIRTREGSLLSIPNKVVLTSDIQNYGHSEDSYWFKLTIHTKPEVRPDDVIETLKKAVLADENVLKDPEFEPEIIFEGLGDSSADYTIRFAAKDYGKKDEYLTSAWKRVWSHLKEAGIEFAPINPWPDG